MATRLTKIIATLGPASGSKPAIRNLVAKGVNIFRLNLSHGVHETVRQWIQWIREVEKERHIFIGILLDLQGMRLLLRVQISFYSAHQYKQIEYDKNSK